MQILLTIHIGNVWVMLWELIATSAIVWAKYKMPCSPLCTSYLWVEFEVRTFTFITFRSERVTRMFVGIVYVHLFCTCHFHHTWVVSLWHSIAINQKNANVFSHSTHNHEKDEHIKHIMGYIIVVLLMSYKDIALLGVWWPQVSVEFQTTHIWFSLDPGLKIFQVMIQNWLDYGIIYMLYWCKQHNN